MDSDDQQHRQRIESVAHDYLDGETPPLICTLFQGEFRSSPWNQDEEPYSVVSTPNSQQSTTEISNIQHSPPVPSPVPGSTCDDSTEEFDSDKTIPYDVYDMPPSETGYTNIDISSSPPK